MRAHGPIMWVWFQRIRKRAALLTSTPCFFICSFSPLSTPRSKHRHRRRPDQLSNCSSLTCRLLPSEKVRPLPLFWMFVLFAMVVIGRAGKTFTVFFSQFLLFGSLMSEMVKYESFFQYELCELQLGPWIFHLMVQIA